MLRDYCSVDPLKSGILTSLSSQDRLFFFHVEKIEIYAGISETYMMMISSSSETCWF